MRSRLYILFILFLISLSSIYAVSTPQYIESLNGKDKIDALNQLASESIDLNSKNLFYYSQRALELSNASKYKNGRVEALINLAIYYYIENDSEKSKQLYLKALSIIENSNDLETISDIYHNLSKVYRKTGFYDKSINNLNLAIELRHKLDNKLKLAESYAELGKVYDIISNVNKAIEYHTKSLDLSETLKDKNNVQARLVDIANIYFKNNDNDRALEYYLLSCKQEVLSDDIFKNSNSNVLSNISAIYLKKKELLLALKFQEKSIERMKIESASKSSFAESYYNIGKIYFEMADHENSLEYFLLSEEYSQDAGDDHNLLESKHMIAILLLKENKINIAENKLNEALSIANSLDLVDNKNNILKDLSNIYAKQNNFEKAFKYQSIFLKTKDSLELIATKSENSSKILKYEAEKKAALYETEVKLEQMENSKLLNLTIFLVALFIVSVTFFISFIVINRKLKNRNEVLSTTNDLLVKTHNVLSNDLKNMLFPVTNHIVNLEENKETDNVKDSYTNFIRRYNNLLDDIVKESDKVSQD